jgi:hypothetical protein
VRGEKWPGRIRSNCAVRNGDGDRRICYRLFAILFWPRLSSGVFTKPEILLRIEGAFDLALSLIFFQAGPRQLASIHLAIVGA